MDLICTNCGEPWEFDYVLHEAPDEFKRTKDIMSHSKYTGENPQYTGNIIACPACEGKPQQLSENEKTRLMCIAEMAEMLGDDVDGTASMIEDFGLDNPDRDL
jgi:hypothetical protein